MLEETDFEKMDREFTSIELDAEDARLSEGEDEGWESAYGKLTVTRKTELTQLDLKPLMEDGGVSKTFLPYKSGLYFYLENEEDYFDRSDESYAERYIPYGLSPVDKGLRKFMEDAFGWGVTGEPFGVYVAKNGILEPV